MTGPFYSIGPIVNATLPASNVTDFITTFRDILLSTNWTLLSTFVGFAGTPGYILKSYPTPNVRNRICVKIYFNGDVSSFGYPLAKVMLSDENQANLQLIGLIAMRSDKGDKTLRCVCGPHQFFAFLDTTIPPNQRYIDNGDNIYTNVMGGCPYVRNPVHSQVFWGCGDSDNPGSFRDRLTTGTGTYGFLINSIIPWTTGFPDPFGNSNNVTPLLLSQRGSNLHSTVPHYDNNWAVIEPTCVIGRVPFKYYAIHFWDSVIVSGNFPSKVLGVADNRNWESLTISTDPAVVGSLFIVTKVLTPFSVGSYSH